MSSGTPVPLDGEERVHAVVDAVRHSGLRARMDFGFLWPSYLRVRLLVTDRRLIEVATPFGGWAAGRCIREFPWSGVRTASVHRRDLEAVTADGSKARWRVARTRDVVRLREAVDARVPVMGGHTGSASEVRTVCPRCAARFTLAEGGCDACDVRFVTPREASWLAVLLPGGGHLATGHHVVGTGRFFVEMAVFVALWSLLGRVDRPQLVLPFAVLILVLLAAFKVEAVMTARGYARLVMPWSRGARRAWGIAGIVGGVLSVGWYASALLNVRQTNLTVLNDLEFHGAEALGWKGAYEQPYEEDFPGWVNRSHWTHADRWGLTVVAKPLARFESPEEWIEAENVRRAGDGWPSGRPFSAGAVDGVRFVKVDGPGWDAMATIEYAIFDRRQRDVHVVSCDLFAGQIDEMDGLLSDLVRRVHWTKAGSPCNPDWRAE